MITRAYFFISLLLFCRGTAHAIPHPFLLVTSSQIAQIRKEIADTASWKNKSWQLLKHTADQLLQEKLEIPPRGGNWTQYYIGPSGYEMVRGKLIGDWQWEHKDLVTGQSVMGDTANITKDYDGVVIAAIHNTWAIGALQLGLAYQISDNAAYAKKVKEILLAYAELYPLLPVHNRENSTRQLGTGAGKLHTQCLNEAIWLIDMAQATDLIWNTLTKQERKKIVDQLLVPGVNLLTANIIASNLQCWLNAATGLVGFLTNDQQLIGKAMGDTLFGFTTQLKRDVGREGMWVEPTLNYHFYSLDALTQLAIAARNYGYPADMQALQKMFTGPLDLCNENYEIPALNDASLTNLVTMEHYLYEWAYSTYGDSRYAAVLSASRRGKFENIGPRFTGWALLFGRSDIAAAAVRRPASVHFSDMGIALLSAERTKDDLICYEKYNTHKGAHIHPDNLAFDIMKGKENILVLSGGENYFSPLYKSWYDHTISSNSFLVDEKQQKLTIGRCLSFGKEKGISYSVVENTNLYDFPHAIRTIAVLNNDLVLIVDQVNIAPSPQVLDFTVHPAGRWKAIPGNTPWIDTTFGYNQISSGTIATRLSEAWLSSRLPSGRQVMISAIQDSAMDVICGYGKKYRNIDLPVAIFRRRSDRAVMAWCISTKGEKISLSMDAPLGINGKVIALTAVARISLREPNGNKWTLLVNPYKIPVAGEPEWYGKEFIIIDKPVD